MTVVIRLLADTGSELSQKVVLLALEDEFVAPVSSLTKNLNEGVKHGTGTVCSSPLNSLRNRRNFAVLSPYDRYLRLLNSLHIPSLSLHLAHRGT